MGADYIGGRNSGERAPTSGRALRMDGAESVFCQSRRDETRVTLSVVSARVSVYKYKTDYPYRQD
jgi:hypothetical protein